MASPTTTTTAPTTHHGTSSGPTKQYYGFVRVNPPRREWRKVYYYMQRGKEVPVDQVSVVPTPTPGFESVGRVGDFVGSDEVWVDGSSVANFPWGTIEFHDVLRKATITVTKPDGTSAVTTVTEFSSSSHDGAEA